MKSIQSRIAAGRFDEVFQILNARFANDSHLNNQLLAVQARYETIRRDDRLGKLAPADVQQGFQDIAQALGELTDALPKPWRPSAATIALITGTVLLAALAIWLLSRSAKKDPPATTQLTVYVHSAGNPQSIVREGQLILDLRNDRRVAAIGEHGRTNFGEIPSEFIGQNILLTLDAPSFEPVNASGQYRWDGAPIYLAVQRSVRSRTISGTVENASGDRRLAGAMIEVDGQTTHSDSLGQFSLVVPEASWKDRYSVRVSLDGYQPAVEFCNPAAGRLPVRLIASPR